MKNLVEFTTHLTNGSTENAATIEWWWRFNKSKDNYIPKGRNKSGDELFAATAKITKVSFYVPDPENGNRAIKVYARADEIKKLAAEIIKLEIQRSNQPLDD